MTRLPLSSFSEILRFFKPRRFSIFATRAARTGGLRLAVFGAALILFPFALHSQETALQGQASAWLSLPFERGRGVPAGLRYIPTFSLKMPVGAGWTFDLEASANAVFTVDASVGWGSRRTEIDPYRAWVRMTTDRFEARLGLQKIEFGSARILRPLMWFDRVDPNDPLQLTDGVTGLLLKYTFQNNAAVWGWGLTGN